VEALGLGFHTTEGIPYWDESAYWQFSADEIDVIEAAAEELHRLCLEAVEHVVSGDHLARLGITGGAAALVKRSWRDRDDSLYGRFDLAWDGSGAPKLLEYNADTPTSLLEAAVVQWHWLEDIAPNADQFNSLHEGLVERWGELYTGRRDLAELYLTCMPPNAEDECTLRYLQATALEAGLTTKVLPLQDIGWDGQDFVDLDDQPIRHLFKLYPWEWLAAEPFATHIPATELQVIEPAWKMVLSNKGLLAVLWELFPGHPNLLPAAFERSGVAAAQVVRKPLLSREGANITVYDGDTPIAQTGGTYGAEGHVWQAWTPLAPAGNGTAVLGTWMIGDRCRGMGIREDDGLITRDTGRFVPHLFA
jgi:glutathionylspermidine synthase